MASPPRLRRTKDAGLEGRTFDGWSRTGGTVTCTGVLDEVAGIQDVARVIYRGPVNLTEWYSSTRLIADQMAPLFPFGPECGVNIIHGGEPEAVPKIEFISGQGMMGVSLGDPPPHCERMFLEGYNHLDVLAASANTSQRCKNEVIEPLMEFVLDNL